MSSGATNHPPGSRTPPLYFTLVDRAFRNITKAPPAALRLADDELGPAWDDLPQTWPMNEVATAANLPGAVTGALSKGPVLLLPPWGRSERRRTGEVSRYEHELMLLKCTPPTSSALLAAVIPATSLVSIESEPFREQLGRDWQPVLVQYSRGLLPGLNHRVVVATVFLSPRVEGERRPLRIFECSAADDSVAVLDDFGRLLARKSGQGAFGYVLPEVPAPGESLAFARHAPRLKARRDSLTVFGGAGTLDEIFEVQPSGFNLTTDRAHKCTADIPGAIRVIGGREIKRDGTIAFPDEDTEWAKVPSARQLQAGDIVVRAITMAGQKLILAEVAEEDLPAVATNGVAVLRPKADFDGSQRSLLVQYLRSELARELLDAPSGAVGTLNRQTLRGLPLPRPDESLSAALSDLADAERSFEAWRVEAAAVLEAAFPDNEDFEAARARLVEHGRNSRLRLEAASNITDQDHIVRTRFPYPVAYRWRIVEAELSAGPSRDAYDAILQAAEVLLCYTANLTLALARTANVNVGYRSTVQASLAKGKGLGFGDWSAILEEVRDGKAFRNLPKAHPLSDLRSLLASNEVAAARKRLNDRRNDDSHLRKVDSTDLPQATKSATADLRALLAAAKFLSDLSLIHVTAVRWDSIRQEAAISYRELMGDHPVVPTRTMTYREPDVEVDSLYLKDTRHRLHLLRPFITGRICPECRNWSTFHADGVRQGVLTLKSLEHGHTVKDASGEETLRQVGLL
ncbi:hypothetical protein ACWED2_09725 [Amycolatopsis sp. NPDC005003]